MTITTLQVLHESEYNHSQATNYTGFYDEHVFAGKIKQQVRAWQNKISVIIG